MSATFHRIADLRLRRQALLPDDSEAGSAFAPDATAADLVQRNALAPSNTVGADTADPADTNEAFAQAVEKLAKAADSLARSQVIYVLV